MLVSILRNLFFSSKYLACLLLGFGFSSQVNALGFTVNPGSIGVNDNPFSADALTVSEVSHISFTDAYGDFTEAGYGKITGATLNNGSAVSTSGLGSDYSMYFYFNDSGNVFAGQLSAGFFSFYAVPGASAFYFDSTNTAQVNNNGYTPTLLGTALLNSGTVGGNLLQGTGYILSASVDSSTFTPTANGSAFFGLSAPSFDLTGNFIHDASVVGSVFPYSDPLAPTDILLIGGSDTLSIAPVPVPSAWAMMMLGLPLLGWQVRRRQNISGVAGRVAA